MDTNPYQPSIEPVIPAEAILPFRERFPGVTVLLLLISGIVTGCALCLAAVLIFCGVLFPERLALVDVAAWAALPLSIAAPIVQYYALRNAKHLWLWLLLTPALSLVLAAIAIYLADR